MGKAVRLRGDDGFALASTIGILGVVTLLVIALTSATINTTRQARREVSWSAALGAALAGVQDVRYRLNSQPDYWRRAPNVDGSPNPALDTANLAFTSFVPVSGATNGATYTYTIDQRVQVAGRPPDGRVIVTSTGAVGGVTRTVRATLRRATFLEYAYLADKGTLDPELYTTWPPSLFDGEGPDRDNSRPADFKYGDEAAAVARLQCAPYYRYSTERPLGDPTDLQGNARAPYNGRHPDCHEAQFNGAVFDGPFHVNDVMVLRGASSTWNDRATTSYGDANSQQLANPAYLQVGSATPTFSASSPLAYGDKIEFPPNNRELRDIAAVTGSGGGYVFLGPTRIVLDGDYIYVDSPASGARYPGMSSAGKGRILLPGNGVIYVDSSPAPCPAGWRPPLGGISGNPLVQNYLAAMYPTGSTGGPNDDITSYSCTAGDAYVEGKLLGKLTIAAQNDVVVTWHIGYASSPTASTPSGYSGAPPATDNDVLGLVADGQIRIFKPTRCVSPLVLSNGTPTAVCFHGYNLAFRTDAGGVRRTVQDLTIYGALLSTKRAMNVANATVGGRIGTLTVVGTLTERFSSYVGTPDTGGGVGGGHQVETSRPEINDTCNDPISTTDPTKAGDPARPQTLVPRSYNGDGSVALCSTVGGLFKRFVYDPRLLYVEPPSFLSPDRVSWNQISFEERGRPAGLPAVPVPSPAPTASP